MYFWYISLKLVEKNLVKCYQLLILAVKLMPRRFQGTRPCHVSVIETFLKFMSKKTRPSSGRVIFMVNLTRPTIGLWNMHHFSNGTLFIPRTLMYSRVLEVWAAKNGNANFGQRFWHKRKCIYFTKLKSHVYSHQSQTKSFFGFANLTALMNFVLQSRISRLWLGNPVSKFLQPFFFFLFFKKGQINGPSFPHLDLHKTLSHWTITLLRITQIPSLGKKGTLGVLCSNFPAPYGEFSQKLPHFFALLKVEKNWAKYLESKTVDTFSTFSDE